VATGHYVRIHERKNFTPSTRFTRPATRSLVLAGSPLAQKRKRADHAEPAAGVSASKVFSLLQAVDENKDQSYFLWTLTQEQLQYCLFPIGAYKKPEVRKMARKFGLLNADKKDSQGICFLGKVTLKDFLGDYVKSRPGQVILSDSEGSHRIIGEHRGAAFYTIGQREGLGIGGRVPEGEPRPKVGGIPYYVAKKDFETNTLVVAKGPFDEQLFRKDLTAGDAHWISGRAPKFPLKCRARIRYRQPLQNCTVCAKNEHTLAVTFDEPQRAVTPGQSIVWYARDTDEMLGGACIS